MSEIEMLHVIAGALRHTHHPLIAEVSADNDNKDGEIIIDTTDGTRFIIRSRDIDVEEIDDE